MAQFKKGDWVQITPNRDYRWGDWKDTHDYFCARIGYVEDVYEDPDFPDNPDEEFVRVAVYFSDYTFTEGPKWYWNLFKKRHLVLTNRTNAKQYYYDEQAAKQTHQFEQSVKQKRDEIFRYMFTDHENKKPKKITRFADDSMDDEKLMADWEEDTPEIDWSHI